MNALDLFGAPTLQRTAFFPRPGVRRLLGRRWGPGPIACVLGCNPSDADGSRDDPTTLWLNAWFQRFGFGGYDLCNLWSFCTSSPRECRTRVEAAWSGEWHDRDELYHNLDLVTQLAKGAAQVFVCFGNIAAWDDDWIEAVVEAIQTGVAPYPDLWCWGKTNSGAPKHPMARGQHRIPRDQKPILWRTAA